MKSILTLIVFSFFLITAFQNCSPASFSSDVHYLDESLNSTGDENPGDDSGDPPTVDDPPADDPPSEDPPADDPPGDDHDQNDPGDDIPPGTPGDDHDHDGDHDEDDDIEKHACESKNDKKVLICHVPSGNIDARHNICISKNALKAHIDKHGDEGVLDYYGECQ